MISDNLKLSGALKIDQYDSSMNLIKSHQFNNLIVSAGKNWMISRATSNSASVMSHMALGSGTTAPASSDTTLQAQIGARKVFGSITPFDNQITFTCTFLPNEPSTSLVSITEAGLFNASTGGTMLSRVKFSTISKANTDTLIVNWVVVLS